MKKFKFFNTELSISEERQKYNRIKLEYEDKAYLAEELFKQVYTKQNRSLDDVSRNARDQGLNIIQEEITKTVNDIVQMGFYNIDESIFISKYYINYYIWDDVFDKINDKYLEIVMDQQQLDEYRIARRQNRGKWQGGGFGVSGAVKGAAKAGAMNMATGAVHATVNGIGKIGSSIAASNKKSKIFKDPNTLDILTFGVGQSVLDIHKALIDFINRNSSDHIESISKSDMEEAKVIFNNIKTKSIDDSIKIDLLRQVISLNPYDMNVYKYILDTYGDENNEIHEIASYFGINLSFYKESVIESLVKGLDISTEPSALKSKEILLDKLERLGFSYDNEYLKQVDKKLEELDLKFRTVSGLECDTREEAVRARREKDSIDSLCDSFDGSNRSDVYKIIEDLKGLDISTAVGKALVSSSIRLLDKKSRSVDGILFESIESAMLAEKQYDEVRKILADVDRNNMKDLVNAKSKIESLNINSDISKNAIENLDKSIRNIVNKSRKRNNKFKFIGILIAAVVLVFIFLNRDKEDNYAIDSSADDINEEQSIETDSKDNSDTTDANIERDISDLIIAYEYDYIEAVNSGDVSILDKYLAIGGKLETEHKKNIPDYYNRGISERLYGFDINNIEKINDKEYMVNVYEEIGITKNGNETLKKFDYTYVIVFSGDDLLIREMISNGSEEMSKSVDGNLDLAIASSTLVDNTDISYRANNLLDDSVSSIWAEGVDGEGIGEWVEISASEGEANISKIGIVNGLCKGDEAYYNNNRVKRALLSFDDGSEIEVVLDDTMEEQIIEIGNKTVSSVRLTILEVYNGVKYNDTCIASMKFY